jgi:small subunit ribosomal protein S21
MHVLVRDNNIDQALRVLKKKMQREGVFREMKRRRFYEKPSEQATREKSEAARRARKLARKQAIRDGLIAAPKKKLAPLRKGAAAFPLRQSLDRSRWGDPVRLFIFESNAKTGLRAFVGDVAGRNLPDQFSPWRQIGAVASGNAPPYNLSRDTIEKAISAHGFQLWRVKPKMA